MRFLLHHPDNTIVSRLIQSLTHGFNIGYFGPHTPTIAKNLPSALEHADIVDEALRKELAENCMAGPYSSAPHTNIPPPPPPHPPPHTPTHPTPPPPPPKQAQPLPTVYTQARAAPPPPVQGCGLFDQQRGDTSSWHISDSARI